MDFNYYGMNIKGSLKKLPFFCPFIVKKGNYFKYEKVAVGGLLYFPG